MEAAGSAARADEHPSWSFPRGPHQSGMYQRCTTALPKSKSVQAFSKGMERHSRLVRFSRSTVRVSCSSFRSAPFATSKAGASDGPPSKFPYFLRPFRSASLTEGLSLSPLGQGSYLNHMFSDAYVQSVPRDDEVFLQPRQSI